VSGSTVKTPLYGYPYNTTIQACFWDKNVTGFTSSYVLDTNSVPLSTAEMKRPSHFAAWDLNTVWKIRSDSTYPGLRGIDNPPFAFADTITANRSFRLSRLLNNDCDVETGRKNLILRLQTASAGTTDSTTIFTFPTSSANGDTVKIKYRVGEVRSSDTLWGTTATSIVILDVNSAVETQPTASASFALRQNYPNPFNPATTISFDIPANTHGRVTLKIFDLLGRDVATLVDENKAAGSYKVVWNAGGLASGIYLYKLQTENYSSVRKLTLLK
jgi:hypothetical protein